MSKASPLAVVDASVACAFSASLCCGLCAMSMLACQPWSHNAASVPSPPKTPFACFADWPAFLPFYEAGEQLDALVAARCGTLDSQDPAFAAPTLCCTGMPSASLGKIAASAIASQLACVLSPQLAPNCLCCSKLHCCRFHGLQLPLCPQPHPPHWRLILFLALEPSGAVLAAGNSDTACLWLRACRWATVSSLTALSHLEHAQDTGTQHCGSLLAVQVNKANATANELYAAHLILRGLAATVRLICIRCSNSPLTDPACCTHTTLTRRMQQQPSCLPSFWRPWQRLAAQHSMTHYLKLRAPCAAKPP